MVSNRQIVRVMFGAKLSTTRGFTQAHGRDPDSKSSGVPQIVSWYRPMTSMLPKGFVVLGWKGTVKVYDTQSLPLSWRICLVFRWFTNVEFAQCRRIIHVLAMSRTLARGSNVARTWSARKKVPSLHGWAPRTPGLSLREKYYTTRKVGKISVEEKKWLI